MEQKNTEPVFQVHHQELEADYAFGSLFRKKTGLVKKPILIF